MDFVSYLINGLSLGSVYAIIALGYTMVYGIAKMLNFAHGDVIMIGAYVALTCMTTAGLPPVASVLAAVVACTALGVLIERVAYKPLRNAASPLAVLITAIGVSYLLQNLALLIFGPNNQSFQTVVSWSGLSLAGGKLNRKCVGRDARTLLSMIGVNAPANIRCIVFEGPKEHPLITTELMMPILGVVRARDFDDAVEQAVWLEHGNRHSAHIHSKNIDNITKYAKAIDTAILVKNAPSYAALGFGGEGYCTFTIASRTGEGLTSASTFTKRRRCVMSDSLCIR